MDSRVSDGHEYENYGLLGYIVTGSDVSEKPAASISSHEDSSKRPASINNITQHSHRNTLSSFSCRIS